MEKSDTRLTFLSPWKALGKTFEIYWSNWLLFTQLAFLAIIPQIAWTIHLRATYDADFYPELSLETVLAEVFSFCLFNTVIQAVMVKVVAEYYAQKHSTLIGSLSILCDRFREIFIFAVIYTLMCFCSLMPVVVVFFAGGDLWISFLLLGSCVFTFRTIFLMTVALPMMIVEKAEVTFLVDKPSEFVSQHGWHFINTMSLLCAPILVGNWIYRGQVDGIFGASPIAIVLKGLFGVLFLPLRTILLTVLGINSRVIGEGLHMESLEKVLEWDGDNTEDVQQVLAAEADGEVETVPVSAAAELAFDKPF